MQKRLFDIGWEVSVKPVTKWKAQKSTGQEWYEVRREIPEPLEIGSRKRKIHRKSGSGEGELLRTLSAKASGTGATSA